MRHAGLIMGMVLSSAMGASAQTPIDMPIAEVLALTSQPFLNRDGFERALLTALPGLRVEPDVLEPPILDPFLWALSGSFGSNEGRTLPGAIFTCARYGLTTREYFAEHRLFEPEAFALMGQVVPLHDDDDVWPEGAVARLYCSFVWDDERVVLILPQAPAHAALAPVFLNVTTAYEATAGTGYRLDGLLGPEDSVAQVEGATIILTEGHQSVTFRSFLMGGGS